MSRLDFEVVYRPYTSKGICNSLNHRPSVMLNEKQTSQRILFASFADGKQINLFNDDLLENPDNKVDLKLKCRKQLGGKLKHAIPLVMLVSAENLANELHDDADPTFITEAT